MEKCIRYIDGVEWVELPYSDEILVTELENRVNNIAANTISMWFSENKKNHGTIYVSIQNLDVTNNYRKIVNHDTRIFMIYALRQKTGKTIYGNIRGKRELLKETFRY